MTLTPSSTSHESRKLTLAYFSNEFPNDDLHDLTRRLHNHSKDKRRHVLARFINEATLAIRDEIRQLPAELRAQLPPFQSILNLVEHPELRSGPLSGSIDGVLLVVIELAIFIGHFELSPAGFDFDPIGTSLAGLGIGLLATAAISLSRTLADIPIAGAEVVRVAFRLGVLVDEVSRNLQPRDLLGTDSPDSWAYVLPDVAPEEIQNELNVFHAKEKTPAASRIFISALSRTSVTISGPPARLKHIFLLSDFFRDCKYVALPVYSGLCHASHIYNEDHVQSIVQTSTINGLHSTTSPGVPVLSTSTGRPFGAKTALGLFENIVYEILTQRIQWDNVVSGVIERARNIEATDFESLFFRISLPIRDLLDTVKSGLERIETASADLVPWVAQHNNADVQSAGTSKSKIAIVGMSCRLPGGATSTELFWDLLEAGLDVHRKIPPDRFDVESHTDTTGKRQNTSHTPYGCFIDEPGLFDAPFFNISPREAQQTDPMQRLALVTAYEALERAGYVADRTAATNLTRIGTFYGQASDDYREVNTAQEISTYFIPGGCRAFGPGRINYFFKFSGPSFSIDTACSSSLATIQAACTSLWNGDTDTVVAGGMNVLTNSDAFAGLSNGHFLTKTPNACKTWDSEADGYCRADGIGSIVLKRLEDAELDNDNILGVILGAGTNHSAEAVSITHPHAGHQSYLSRQVLSSAGIDPLDVSFVEMHGTGTQAGDTEEIKSVTDVYAPLKKRRTAKQPLYIGAVKSNVGHGEAVAGITALMKLLLMFQKEAIPPHAGIKHKLNPAFPQDLEKRNLKIPYERQSWPRTPGKKRIAAVNNFSAAGGNTTLLIEEPPIKKVEQSNPRTSHVVSVTAKSKVSLRGNLERLIAYLDTNPKVSLSDLSYSTTARRYQHNHRVTAAITDIVQLKKRLASSLDSVDSHKPVPSTGPPPVAFAFTGQGASHKSSNLELLHENPYFRSQILHLDSLAQQQGFPSFVPAIDGSYPKDHAHSPVITQLALTATQIALAKYWGSLGVKPDVVIGHSLGEYAALNAAGVLSASDALFLVGSRAALLEEKCKVGSHKMLAVRATLGQIKEVAQDKLYEIACINGPKENVLSGDAEQILVLAKALEEAGYKTFSLDVAFAFHSAQTDPILDEFESIAKSAVLFQAPHLPVISPLLGKVVFDEKTINANYVRRATREAVNFVAALETAERISTIDDSTVWVEIGPHPVSTGFVKSTISEVNTAVPSLRRDEDNWSTITKGLAVLHNAGVDIAWNEYHRQFERALRLLDLPTYSWNDKNYWIQYNGDWALTKGNSFYDAEKGIAAAHTTPSRVSDLTTSTVHQVIEEHFDGTYGKVVMQSDLMQPDFLAAAHGHQMNGCGVVTSVSIVAKKLISSHLPHDQSIHADIAYTLGQYLHKKLRPKVKDVHIDVANLVVVKGLVANKNTKTPQLIRVTVETSDLNTGVADLTWHNVQTTGTANEPFATANLFFGDGAEWLRSWIPATHLVQGRIQALEHLAKIGQANRFSRAMAYKLFASSLVNYAEKYRGMQAVVLYGLEAFADVSLTTEKGGIWTVPPYFIDSVAHLAGFTMNVSDAVDTVANFCVTPGWSSMRFARPLIAGAKYRSYVKMIPTAEDQSVYLGDVYILQADEIIGFVGGIKFRRYPRLLLDRFFSAPDADGATGHGAHQPAAPSSEARQKETHPQIQVKSNSPAPGALAAPAVPAASAASAAASKPPADVEIAAATKPQKSDDPIASIGPDSTAYKAISIVASETGIELSEISDDASFANLGVDSLMSLVIAEKLRSLGVTVGGSLFLEYPTVGDLKAWLLEYYD